MGLNFRQAFKTVYSSPLLLVKQLKKISKDSFIAGLVFGAVFSLLVNLITVQFQEVIAKQKTLEALEREIYSHLVQSELMRSEALQALESEDYTDAYAFTNRFSTSVWDSGAASGYIYDLDPTIQDALYRYYTTFIDDQNRHMEHAEASVNQMEYDDMYCLYIENYSEDYQERCKETWTILQLSVSHFEEVRILIADAVRDQGTPLLNDFHPTRDRLDSWFLKLFMGDEVSDIVRQNRSSEL